MRYSRIRQTNPQNDGCFWGEEKKIELMRLPRRCASRNDDKELSYRARKNQITPQENTNRNGKKSSR